MSDDKPNNSTANIFANARRSAKSTRAADAAPRTSALTCQHCGAPRKDGVESLRCSFCGQHMVRPNPAE